VTPADVASAAIVIATWIAVAWIIPTVTRRDAEREARRRRAAAGRARVQAGIAAFAARPRPLPPVLEPPPVPTVPWTGCSELIGRRLWGLCRWWEDGELRLTSLWSCWAWDGPVLRAHTRPEIMHAYPDPTYAGRAGIYAFKPEAATWMDTAWMRYGLVSGHVALSGRVIEHELGYRAERCVIRDLRLGPAAIRAFGNRLSLRAAITNLEWRYQVEVACVPGKLSALVRSVPRFVPDEFHRFYYITKTDPLEWRLG